jgi:SAM-dependent methyltransferase
MAQHKTWSMQGGGAEIYERVRVPGEFEPLARLLLQHVVPAAGERVLDVACGTGIVARLAVAAVGLAGQVTGLDLDPAMLEVAARATAGMAIIWREGDAMALPFGDAGFDAVLCQQGLQFFPERLGALKEMRRVLRAGGRLGACLWQDSDFDPFSLAVGAALARHAGAEAAAHATYSFGGKAELAALVVNAGFTGVDVAAVNIKRSMGPPAESIPTFFASSGRLNAVYNGLQPDLRSLVVSDIASSLAVYATAEGMQIPRGSFIVTAHT